MESMNLPRIAWSLIPMFALLTAPARADVVPPLPDECPPGSAVDYGCGSAFCRAFLCETDADCKGGDCEPVKGCFGENDGLKPPPIEHGGSCLRGEMCSDKKLTCQTLGLCVSFGDGTTGDGATGATNGTATTGVASAGTASTGGLPGTSTGAATMGSTPTGGGLSTGTSGATGAGGSSETSGGGGSRGGGGCSCSLVGGSPGLLGLLGFAALRRRRSQTIA
jgi:MYXO-CTERM domain-containing protein